MLSLSSKSDKWTVEAIGLKMPLTTTNEPYFVTPF